MVPYNVEIFDKNMNYISHDAIDQETFEFYEDYLDPERNNVMVRGDLSVELDQYIRVMAVDEVNNRVVSKIEEGGLTKNLKTITYKPFITLLDVDVVVNTKDFGVGTFENYIAAKIRETYIENKDKEQNIPGLQIKVETQTRQWSLAIPPQSEDVSHAVANLFDEIILAAFKQNGIILRTEYEIRNRKVVITITKNTENKKIIEADLDNVLSKRVIFRKAQRIVNKTIIYNTKSYSYCAIYYLHTDETFSKTNMNRSLPVAFTIDTVSTELPDEAAKNIVSALQSDARGIKDASEKGRLTDEEKKTVSDAVKNINKYLSLGLKVGSGGYAYRGSAKITDITFIETAVESYEGTAKNKTDGSNRALESFEAEAHKKAESSFASNQYENLIEIECEKTDGMIGPLSMDIGQVAGVISNGAEYETILTGRKISDTALLTFGTIRLELTKQLKGRG